MSNADETHFFVNMDNGKTLGFCRDEQVKYAYMTSGRERITMLFCLSDRPHAIIKPPLMIFRKKYLNYPIKGFLDNILGTAHRAGPTEWMDGKVMKQWTCKSCLIKRLPYNRICHLFYDNCSGHNLDEEISARAEDIMTSISFFFPNATDLIQQCASFIIQKIKNSWRHQWDKYKLTLLQSNFWMKGDRLSSPGKPFILRLFAEVVADVTPKMMRTVSSMQEMQ